MKSEGAALTASATAGWTTGAGAAGAGCWTTGAGASTTGAGAGA